MQNQAEFKIIIGDYAFTERIYVLFCIITDENMRNNIRR